MVAASTSAELLPLRMYSRQASVWMVKPGGTGSPARVISATPAPLPPSSFFISAVPSDFPAPKKYTYWIPGFFGETGWSEVTGMGRAALIAEQSYKGELRDGNSELL